MGHLVPLQRALVSEALAAIRKGAGEGLLARVDANMSTRDVLAERGPFERPLRIEGAVAARVLTGVSPWPFAGLLGLSVLQIVGAHLFGGKDGSIDLNSRIVRCDSLQRRDFLIYNVRIRGMGECGHNWKRNTASVHNRSGFRVLQRR